MLLHVTRNKQKQTIEIQNYEFWHRRLFGKAIIDNKEVIVISSYGFEELLVKTYSDGMHFEFKMPKVYNPYIAKDEVGPKEYSGVYEKYADIGNYISECFFETIIINESENDIFKYQNDEMYHAFRKCASLNKKPKLIMVPMEKDPDLATMKIIHGVFRIGENEYEEYVDYDGLEFAASNDLPFEVVKRSPIHTIYKDLTDKFSMPKLMIFPGMSFCKLDSIKMIQEDLGDHYIKKHLYFNDRKTYAFRHLYEYFKVITKATHKRRRSDGSPYCVAKKEEWDIHYNANNGSYMLVLYTNLRRLDARDYQLLEPNETINGTSVIKIPFFYNSDSREFESDIPKKEILENSKKVTNILKLEIGVLGKIYGDKYKDEYGRFFTTSASFGRPSVKDKQLPKIKYPDPTMKRGPISEARYEEKLRMAIRKGEIRQMHVKPIRVECIRHYVRKEGIFTDLSDLLCGLCQFHPDIHNLLRHKHSVTILRKFYEYLDIYKKHSHELVKTIDDPVEDCMIFTDCAIMLIQKFEKIGPYKNRNWYRAANKIIMFYAQIPEDDIVEPVVEPIKKEIVLDELQLRYQKETGLLWKDLSYEESKVQYERMHLLLEDEKEAERKLAEDPFGLLDLLI